MKDILSLNQKYMEIILNLLQLIDKFPRFSKEDGTESLIFTVDGTTTRVDLVILKMNSGWASPLLIIFVLSILNL